MFTLIRRGVFRSVPELVEAIEEYLLVHNNDRQPFMWSATAESILAKVRRGRVTSRRCNPKLRQATSVACLKNLTLAGS